MYRVKTLVSAVALAALASLPLAAQQPSSAPGGSQPDAASPQTTPQNNPNRNDPAPHSDPSVSPQNQPSTAQPDPGSTQAAPGQGTSGNAASGNATTVPHTANAPEVNNADLRPVKAELVGNLDTKKAKNGDPVVLKTTEKATTASGLVIPKGSKIVGRVVDVQAHDGANQNSKVALQFDQAELKGGQTMPIKSVLQSVSPAADEASPSAPAALPSGGAPSSPSGSASGASPMGGSASGSASGTPSAQTAPMQGSPSAASPGVATASSGPAPGTVVAQQGNIQIKTTSVPGVLIAGNVNGQPFANASGALLGAQQNVHLDGGTHVVLAVADANTKASTR